MADANVGIKFSGMEYRFLRSELEIHANNLKDRANEMRAGKVKADLRQRENQIRKLLREI